MIVLDTNVVSETVRPAPDGHVMRWLAEHTDEVTITAVTVAELSVGMEIMPDGRRKDELRSFLAGVFDAYGDLVLDLDMASGQLYGRVVADRRAAGHPITREDAMLAAICFAHGFPLATRNVKDFRGLGLVLINPWDASPAEGTID